MSCGRSQQQEEAPDTQIAAAVIWQQSPKGKGAIAGVESSGLGIVQSRDRIRCVHAVSATLGGSP